MDPARQRTTMAGSVGRMLGVVVLLATFPVTYALTPRGQRERVQRGYARSLLRCCGVRMRVADERGVQAPGGFTAPGQGALVVAGHISWLDILVLAAVQPVGFVARADMVGWPVLGWLARMMRVIPIERERLRQLPEVIEQIGARIEEGERVAVFPEGTTWCGRGYGSLRPALFQAAIDTQTVVQPVRLRYLDRHDAVSTRPGFVGDDTLVSSLWRMLRGEVLVAEVILAPPQHPGTDRRELAARCARVMRREFDFDFSDSFSRASEPAHGIMH